MKVQQGLQDERELNKQLSEFSAFSREVLS